MQKTAMRSERIVELQLREKSVGIGASRLHSSMRGFHTAGWNRSSIRVTR